MRIRKARLSPTTGHFTAHALAKMYRAIANRGEVEGVRLVSPKRIRHMPRLITDRMDLVVEPSRMGIGFFLGSPNDIVGPKLSSAVHSV